MIKGLIFDIDGTLVSLKTHKMPDNTIYALENLRENGMKLFVATGRSPFDTDLPFSFDGYITTTGQYCYTGDQVIHESAIDSKNVEKIYDLLGSMKITAVFISDYMEVINFETENFLHTLKVFNHKPCRSGTREEILNMKVYQITAFIDEKYDQEIVKQVPDLHVKRWNDMQANFINVGNNKSVGIRHMLKHFKLNKEEIMAFGDGGNDIDMLKDMQIGVAMGNSKDDVKKSADYVCESVDEDGIYKAMLHFGLIKEKE